ncbi:MAG: hypothetical protein AAF682_28735 [Planctomycetota bacterium]
MKLPVLTTAAGLLLPTLASAQTWSANVQADNGSTCAIGIGPNGIALAYRGSGQAETLQLDPHGEIDRTFEHRWASEDVRWCTVLPDEDGNLFLAGTSGDRPLMCLIDGMSGQQLWSTRGSDQTTELSDACRTSDGRYVAIGTRETASGVERPFVWSFHPPTHEHWRQLLGDGINDEEGRAVEPLSDGRVALITGVPGEVRLSWANEGGILPTRIRISSPDGLGAAHAAATADDGLIVAGLSQGRIFATRLDAGGVPLWSTVYLTYAGEPFFWSTPGTEGVIALPDGGFALAVTQPKPGSGVYQDDAAVLRLGADGDPLYLRAFGTPADERALDIAATPEGGIVLVGRTENGGTLRVVRLDSKGKAPVCSYFGHGFDPGSLELSAVPEALLISEDPSQLGGANLIASSASSSVDVFCIDDCSTSGSHIGNGVAGSGGLVPVLNVVSGACQGWTPSLELSKGLGGAPGLLAYGFASTAVPFLGGTLYIDPAQLFLAPLTLDGTPGVAGDGTATFQIPATIDLATMKGVPILAQALLLDDAAAQGVSMTWAATLHVQ